MTGSAARRTELAAGLAAVEQRVRAACHEAGRDRSALTLVVVTKTFPASDVCLLAELGVTDVGESRHPEAGRKVKEVTAAGHQALRWHFVGAVQTNKAAAVVGYADLVHSVDRLRLVGALERAAREVPLPARRLEVLVQVDLHPGGERGRIGPRSGAAGAALDSVLAAVADADSLRLRGVMAVAPLDGDPGQGFHRLAGVAASVRAAHPGADIVSAGMSDDLEHAVRAGATHLRVGRAVLGERPVLR